MLSNYFRYSTGEFEKGEVQCYFNQRTTGDTSLWKKHAPLPKGFKLPE